VATTQYGTWRATRRSLSELDIFPRITSGGEHVVENLLFHWCRLALEFGYDVLGTAKHVSATSFATR
jgi:hypothetical protein